jgi:hypothetical protein
MMAHELSAIHSAIARNMQELSVLINDGDDRRMARAAGELGAAIEGMEKATQKILASAEVTATPASMISTRCLPRPADGSR